MKIPVLLCHCHEIPSDILYVQIGSEPDIVLFFDCPEDEMVKRVLNRNQVLSVYPFSSVSVIASVRI